MTHFTFHPVFGCLANKQPNVEVPRVSYHSTLTPKFWRTKRWDTVRPPRQRRLHQSMGFWMILEIQTPWIIKLESQMRISMAHDVLHQKILSRLWQAVTLHCNRLPAKEVLNACHQAVQALERMGRTPVWNYKSFDSSQQLCTVRFVLCHYAFEAKISTRSTIDLVKSTFATSTDSCTHHVKWTTGGFVTSLSLLSIGRDQIHHLSPEFAAQRRGQGC